MEMKSFLRIPRQVAMRKDLTLAARMVYGALHGHAWGKKTEVWPGKDRIARAAGISERTADAAIHQLADAGLLTITHRKDPDNSRKNLSNYYTLLIFED